MKTERKKSIHNNKEILIVEDSPTQATQIKHLLESNNYKVSVAQNGKQAMDLIKKQKPSIVISDIMMPEMNGYELCKKIKFNKNTEDIPVILLTILSDPEEIIEGITCGADSFISKPYNKKYLLSHIEQILSEENVEDQKKVPFGTKILFKGKKRFIQAEQQNVIKLLLDIYEGAVHQNEKLIQTREELRLLNERLESLVEDRTADLTAEVKLSNQIANRLKESEEKWRTLVTTIPEYIGLIDCEGKLLFLNHYAEEFSEKDTIGKSHLDFIPAEWKEFYRQKFEKCISALENQIFEYNAFGDNNAIRTYETCLVPVIHQGKVSNVLAITRDITERKQADKELSDSELRYRRLFEAARDGILILDAETGMIVEVNQFLIGMLGFSREQFLQKCIWELGFFRDIVPNKDNFKKLQKNKYICYDDKPLETSNGRKIEVEFVSFVYKVGDHKVIQCNIRDITKRKQAEEAIDQERRMLRTLIDNLPDPIYVMDKVCRKVIANNADVKNIGSRYEKEVLGKTDLELFPGPAGKRGYDYDKKVIDSGKAIYGLEEDFIDKMGIRRWLLTTKVPLMDKHGEITGLVGIGHDITERKRVEEELIKAKDKAEESDRLKTAFLHNISHEIRTPMNAIVGFSALLGEPDVDAQTQQSYVEMIMQSSNHLLSIITDIVDISNIEANLAKIAKNEINLNSTLKSLCNQFTPKAEEKKIKLECEYDLSGSDVLIITDSTKLNQILSNLVNNALKFTDKGSIKLLYKLKENFLEFCVSDTGIGIRKEYHNRIFDRFYQVQNIMSRIYEGTGLGLAISKAYVELLGGKIWLSSEPGKGASFFFTIPYEKQNAEASVVTKTSITESFIFQKRKKILVVEDVESNFKLISYFLSGANTTLLHASNGKEAVDTELTEKNIDIILMDIKMPVMDGFTATKLIREKNPTIPIIVQTAYVDEKEKAFDCGCSGFISKPFDKKGLLRILSEYI